jgi:hypothetical protein
MNNDILKKNGQDKNKVSPPWVTKTKEENTKENTEKNTEEALNSEIFTDENGFGGDI